MPLFRRRPLLRAAAVGGGAYYMGQRHAETQQREYEQDERLSGLEDQQYAPAPQAGATAGGVGSDAIEQLKQLGQLHEQGVLTDEEFAQQKAKILNAS